MRRTTSWMRIKEHANGDVLEIGLRKNKFMLKKIGLFGLFVIFAVVIGMPIWLIAMK